MAEGLDQFRRPSTPQLPTFKPRRLNFDEPCSVYPTLLKPIQFVEIKNTSNSDGVLQVIQIPPPVIDHHIPPSFLQFIPPNLERVGYKYGGLIVDSEIEIHKVDPERVSKQLQYWENLNDTVADCTIINSVIIMISFDGHPYDFDFGNAGPLIGICKRAGQNRGQAVWFTLPEAQALVQLFIKLLNHTKNALKGLPTKDPDSYSLAGWSYDPVSFVSLGIVKDYVYVGQLEKVGATELQASLTRQSGTCWDSRYPVGSVDALVTILGRRRLFGLIKKKGLDAGQRVWFSCHELQHLLVDLVEKIRVGAGYVSHFSSNWHSAVGRRSVRDH